MENALEVKKLEVVSYTFTDFFCVISIMLSIFFNQYDFIISGITLGEVLLIISCGLIFVRKRGSISAKKCRAILIFYFSALALSIMAIFTTNVTFGMESRLTVITRWIRYFAYMMFMLFFIDNYNDRHLFFKIYKIACIIVSGYAILQYFTYLILHIYLPVNILPFLSTSKDLATETLLTNAETYYFRVYSIFAEPSYLAKFLLPGAVISFYGFGVESKRINFVTLSLIAVALILSSSLQGMVILIVSLLICLTCSLNNNFVKSLLIIVVLAVIAVFMVYSGYFNSIITRLNKVGDERDYSTNIRLYRGFAFWGQLPFVFKFFGVGLGNAANYADTYDIYTPYDYYFRNSATLQYMNGISGIMVEIGLIGLVLFLIFLIPSFRKVKKEGKIILIQFLLILLTGSSFFSLSSVFYFYIIYLYRKDAIE